MKMTLTSMASLARHEGVPDGLHQQDRPAANRAAGLNLAEDAALQETTTALSLTTMTRTTTDHKPADLRI